MTQLTTYEVARRCLEPFLPPIYSQVRKRILTEIHGKRNCSILDVGGRKSPYTIGVPADVTIIDLPRESEIQKMLNLGINDGIVDHVKRRRSNIHNMVFGDMTQSELESNSFDFVVSVEVLEHVEEDEKFVREVYRVLKPGGSFIMTTPNGDFVANTNPDHKRHYRKYELETLLSKHFDAVEIDYAIAGGRYRKMGLQSWSVRKPIKTFASVLGNIVNAIQSAKATIRTSNTGTHHLMATARKF